MPSLLGSLAFVFSSLMYLAEVTHSYNPFARPPSLSLGYAICMLNLLGSALFTAGSLGYFARALPRLAMEAPHDGHHSWGWQYEVSEWGVRFPFGLGSVLFLIGSFGSLIEVMSEPSAAVIVARDEGKSA